MYDSDDYLAAKRSDGNTTIKRVFFFTHPVVAYRVKIHKMFGDDIIAVKVDFLGTVDISQKDPFKDGTIEKSIGDSVHSHVFYLIFSMAGYPWTIPSQTSLVEFITTDDKSSVCPGGFLNIIFQITKEIPPSEKRNCYDNSPQVAGCTGRVYPHLS